jgi:hypothetical protein
VHPQVHNINLLNIEHIIEDIEFMIENCWLKLNPELRGLLNDIEFMIENCWFKLKLNQAMINLGLPKKTNAHFLNVYTLSKILLSASQLGNKN